MAASTSSSASTSLASCSPITYSSSIPPSSPLHSLPAVLLPQVCSHLYPRQLLVGLAQTSHSIRQLLTPACFSQHSVELGFRAISLLSASSSLTSAFHHSRLLSDHRLYLTHNDDMRHVLNSLDHFPSCGKLTVDGWRDGSDVELHALLHHPTTRGCSELSFSGFHRLQAEMVPLAVERARVRNFVLTSSCQLKVFDWADVRLPTVTRLSLRLTVSCSTSAVLHS